METLPPGVTIEGSPSPSGPETPSPSVSIPNPMTVQLPPNCTWSRDAADLALATYFDPTKPNLGTDYGIAGLVPVIRDTQSLMFLLSDAQGTFYQWDMLDGQMFRLLDMTDIRRASKAVMRDSGIMNKIQVWNLSRDGRNGN
ncbi:hypothetical protein E4U42_001306 [Claviceps africana]|uniref:Uncharacterized protein n=1 Tax=Claviceps africana TaxID=83212 RepID=A0A8K0NKD6_9HYPO|nr:hypothetical protein E4U42_001306 [Claviceps africana]